MCAGRWFCVRRWLYLDLLCSYFCLCCCRCCWARHSCLQLHTHSRPDASLSTSSSTWVRANIYRNIPPNTLVKHIFFYFSVGTWSFFVVVSLLLDWPKDCGMAHFKPNMAERIVSGNEARPHSWPWQVSLQVNLYLNWRDSVFKEVGGLQWLQCIDFVKILHTQLCYRHICTFGQNLSPSTAATNDYFHHRSMCIFD